MESNYQQSGDNAQTQGDALDRELDRTLMKYAAVEPRAGLEQRILAHLRSEQASVPTRSWWQLSTAGIVAALIVMVVLLWRSNKPPKTVAQHPPAPIEAVPASSAQIVTNNRPEVLHPFAVQQTNARHRQVHQLVVVAADAPKLDQFPSPRPLSEQEKLALEYVARFPHEASLLARAQSNFERQQEMEERQGQTNSQ